MQPPRGKGEALQTEDVHSIESPVAPPLALVSVVIPTFNGASRISGCLHALHRQIGTPSKPLPAIEVLVIDDGSEDSEALCSAIFPFPGVRIVTQANAGPAAARNRGAQQARGELLLFTDDDCVPLEDWLAAMLAPFQDPAVIGAKGIYRTHQRGLVARFVQIEYEDKYRTMAAFPAIDFIDTYSAAFRRDHFLETGGYDTSFPVACAEDVELSFRMSARGWLMKFAPDAVVFHTHPDSFVKYLRKKYKFAFWRVLAVRKNPSKAAKDTHTPQIMKLQLLFGPALFVAALLDVTARPRFPATLGVCSLFLLSTLPFVLRAARKDPVIALLSPLLLAARACAQFLGVAGGLLYARRLPVSAVSGMVQ